MNFAQTIPLLAALLLCCDGRLVKSATFPTSYSTITPTPSVAEPTPRTETPENVCSYEKTEHCQKMRTNAFALMFSPHPTASSYSSRVCRSLKDYIDCTEAAGPSCAPSYYTMALYKAMCEYEGNCRLADTASYCMASYGPITPTSLPSYANICRHRKEVDTCAAAALKQAGCTSKNRAWALWVFYRLVIEGGCYLRVAGLTNGCIPISNTCVFGSNVASLMSGIVEANRTKICRYTMTAAKCFQARAKKLPSGQCDSARQYYQDSLQLSSEINAYCSQCSSNGNVYKVVPNTQCTVFSQSLIGQSPSGTQTCPLNTVFDVHTCVCNFAANVICVV